MDSDLDDIAGTGTGRGEPGSLAGSVATSGGERDKDSIRLSSTGEVVTHEGALADPRALRELRGEKRRLQVSLREYERSFEEREGRKVKFVKDISPVLAHYTRYKEIRRFLKDIPETPTATGTGNGSSATVSGAGTGSGGSAVMG